LARAEALTVDPAGEQIAALVRASPPCVASFEAGWLIVGDRFPDPGRVGHGAADLYVTGLIAGDLSGHGFDLLAAPAAEAEVRRFVESCPTVIVGSRGRWHLGRLWPWLASHYEQVATTTPGGPDIWRRRPT